jgi:HEAT repeat protein
VSSESWGGKTPYDIRTFIERELRAFGFAVLPENALQPDATLRVKYTEREGAEYLVSGRGTQIECEIELHHPTLGVVFRENIGAHTAPSLSMMEGLHHSAIRNFEDNLRLALLGVSMAERLGKTIPEDQWLRLSKHTGANVRLHALGKILEIRGPAAIQVLVPFAQRDGSEEVRRYALEKIVEIRGPDSIARLVPSALQDRSPALRLYALKQVEKTSNPDFPQRLVAALRDDAGDIRVYAAETLGRRNEKRAFQPLLLMLKDSDHIIRGAAASALGDLRDARAVEPLIAIIDKVGDEYLYVIVRATEALGKIRDPRAAQPLRRLAERVADEDTKQAAEQALANVARAR